MGLQERLDAAARERRRAAGLPIEPAPSSGQDPSTADATVTTLPLAGTLTAPREATLDLRDDAPVIELHPDRRWAGGVVAAGTTACPACGGVARTDMEDVVGGVDHLCCTECGLLFQVAR